MDPVNILQTLEVSRPTERLVDAPDIGKWFRHQDRIERMVDAGLAAEVPRTSAPDQCTHDPVPGQKLLGTHYFDATQMRAIILAAIKGAEDADQEADELHGEERRLDLRRTTVRKAAEAVPRSEVDGALYEVVADSIRGQKHEPVSPRTHGESYESECLRARRLAKAGLSEGDMVKAMGVDRLTLREMLEIPECACNCYQCCDSCCRGHVNGDRRLHFAGKRETEHDAVI